MATDIISKKTRSEFKEYFVTTSLRVISSYFDNHNVLYTELAPNINYGGERRTLVENYYTGVDWNDLNQCQTILNVYEDVLNDLSDKVGPETWNAEQNKIWLEKLIKVLDRNGFSYENAKLLIAGIDTIINFEGLQNATNLLDKAHFQEYTERIKKSVSDDPSLAIGSTKELLESTLKTILVQLQVEYDKDDDVPKLLKAVQKALELVPDGIDDAKKGADIIKVLLSNLGQVVIKLTELRNLYGTGHGKEQPRKGLTDRHAKLAVGAGITLATFLLETFEHRRKK